MVRGILEGTNDILRMLLMSLRLYLLKGSCPGEQY